jgi:hypothetical protein
MGGCGRVKRQERSFGSHGGRLLGSKVGLGSKRRVLKGRE